MKIVKQSYEILSPIDADYIYKQIERAARTCYKSEDKIKDGSAEKMVRALVRNQHEAMLEHASITVKFITDRAIANEIVRHRLCSYAQESTRYCVAGDTWVTFSNCRKHMTIKELYDNLVSSRNGAFKRMKIKYYNSDTGELEYGHFKNIFYNGNKDCIKLTTKLGYTITCTPDHEILTGDGYVQAGNLEVGKTVMINGTAALYLNKDWLWHQNIDLNKTFVAIADEFGFNVSTLKKWARIFGLPQKGTGYYNIGRIPWNKGAGNASDSQVEALRKYHHCGRRKDYILKEDTSKYQKHMGPECEICGATEDLEVHHIDKTRTNHSPSNLITVCSSCHQRIHSQNLLTTYIDSIISVEDAGIQDVYDIEMDNEFHNFVANGIVVHNCNYKDGIEFIEPIFNHGEEHDQAFLKWSSLCNYAENAYGNMIASGCTPEEARSVLPLSTKTEIVVTANLRELRHIFDLRVLGITGAPHPQIRALMAPLLKELAEKLPVIFGDQYEIYKDHFTKA